MNFSEQIERLRQLQQVDSQLYQLRQQKQEKPLVLERSKQQVAAQEARVKETESRLKAFQLGQKEKEVELQSREGQIKKLQGQLFQVKTNKEYSAMQHEIETIKADNSVLEEAILKIFDEIEVAGRQRQDEQKQLAAVQETYKKEEAVIRQELAVIQQRIEQLEKERQALTPTIPAAMFDVYERILSSRKGLAMAPLALETESCGGCHRRLPPQVINQVRLKAKLTTCESCNRILYLDENSPSV